MKPDNSTDFSDPIKKLFSDQFLKSYNYGGTNGKQSFKDLQVNKMLFGKYLKIINVYRFLV